jgi:Tol biopolymer transport system component
MALASGTRLGPYEIQALAGAGGMGEVYKARDTRLERTVAVKILPENLALDGQFRERFEREARTISQLDHPNICALYDVGEHEGRWYLVMQYLEGETLAARLAKGALPPAEALPLAIQIAAALDKAHRAGVVHRDLKPGNVMLTKSGARLLDFGLAKTTLAAPLGVSMLPTTPANITAQGTILGTFQYMAPEQVEGQETDARTDIFAFGAVLYEMVTGRPAFQGRTQASLIGAILRDDPTTAAEIAPMVPPALNRVIRTCLAKSPDDRFQTMHDVSLQLQWIVEGGSQAGVPAPVAVQRRARQRLAWSVAAVATLAAAALAVVVVTRETPTPRLVRFEVATPAGVLAIDAPKLSPDGATLAFNATDPTGQTRIWLRPLQSLQAYPLAGTEGTTRPFWSPDSAFLGFFADGKLKKIAVSGGPAQAIADAPTGADGSWSSEGVILFDGRATDPIYRVPAAGGVPAVAAAADPARKESAVGWPEFLPDGRHFLYLAMGDTADTSTYRIGVLDSLESQAMTSAQTQVAYAPPGFLLFVRDRTLVAQPFDATSLKTTGEPVPLAERIGTDNVGLARFSVSRDGTLAYRTGEAGNRLLWVDRTGREIEALGDPGEYATPALSPDGRRLAYRLADPRSAKADIWIRDLVRGVNSRFTFAAGNNEAPIWSPDGATIVFNSDRGGVPAMYEKPASGQGEEKVLFQTPEIKVPTDWSRDGRYIAFMHRSAKTDFDVWVLPMFGDRKPFAVIESPFVDTQPRFSPDGRFIAYASNESGRVEVYVQTFPAASGKWQISNAGGGDPVWRGDGREIFYRATDQKLMAVDIQTAGGFQAGVPRNLFLSSVVPGNARNKHIVSPDGQRFLLVAPLGGQALVPTTVVLNWYAELQR